jgi:hypothetical protein
MPFRTSLHTPRATLYALAMLALPVVASAQIISIKTLPIALGDQFNFFPSANQAMGGVSMALTDSLLDPFINPAKGARLRPGAMQFFGSPTFYSISRAAGGGQTLPVGGLMSKGNLFGGAVYAMQELNPSHADAIALNQPVPLGARSSTALPLPAPEQGRNKYNRYAFATLGRRVTNGFSLAGSVLYADLHRIDGVDQLYSGSQSVTQYGGDLDARLGVVRDWEGGSSVEALILHERLAMTHDVTFAETFYDPNTRFVNVRPRVERNLDRTNTWGVHFAWQRPVGDSGWRVGAILTGNLLTHPKLPNYQVVDIVRPVPWDPGHSAAYNFGIGVSQHQGFSTFALDLIYEPILTHTWGETPAEIQTASGSLIPAGGRTTENHFTFSNVIARLGFGQDIPIEGASYPLRLQGGISAHSIHYWLDQDDHVQITSRRQYEQWVEWAPSWGASMRFGGVDLRYVGTTTHGTGRPGIVSTQFFGVNPAADVALGSTNILAAPSGPLTLTPVSVTTHQLSVAVPLP